MSVGQAAVDCHAIRRQRRAQNVLIPRRRDPNLLVQAVIGVGNRAQVRTADIAAKAGRLPVADGVIGVAELLAGNGRRGRKIRPIAFGTRQFIPVVITILPKGTIFQRRLRASVQGVILVTVGGDRGVVHHVGDAPQPHPVIPSARCRQNGITIAIACCRLQQI